MLLSTSHPSTSSPSSSLQSDVSCQHRFSFSHHLISSFLHSHHSPSLLRIHPPRHHHNLPSGSPFLDPDTPRRLRDETLFRRDRFNDFGLHSPSPQTSSDPPSPHRRHHTLRTFPHRDRTLKCTQHTQDLGTIVCRSRILPFLAKTTHEQPSSDRRYIDAEHPSSSLVSPPRLKLDAGTCLVSCPAPQHGKSNFVRSHLLPPTAAPTSLHCSRHFSNPIRVVSFRLFTRRRRRTSGGLDLLRHFECTTVQRVALCRALQNVRVSALGRRNMRLDHSSGRPLFVELRPGVLHATSRDVGCDYGTSAHYGRPLAAVRCS